jgi:hypothetical protein
VIPRQRRKSLALHQPSGGGGEHSQIRTGLHPDFSDKWRFAGNFRKKRQFSESAPDFRFERSRFSGKFPRFMNWDFFRYIRALSRGNSVTAIFQGRSDIFKSGLVLMGPFSWTPLAPRRGTSFPLGRTIVHDLPRARAAGSETRATLEQGRGLHKTFCDKKDGCIKVVLKP